jgi:enterochelin esterase family protein
MRRVLFSLLLKSLVLAVVVLTPNVASAKGSVETGRTVYSPSLGHSIQYSIYIPGEQWTKGRRLPVLYLLHGHGGNETDWLKLADLANLLDRGIELGWLKPLIVVMPMAGNSWYVDDQRKDGFGPVAKAMTGDLTAAIDSLFPTLACREARAIGGLSMGGYGAMLYAFDRPDLYAAVISLSGSLFHTMPTDEKYRGKSLSKLFDGIFGTPFDWSQYSRWSVFEKMKVMLDRPHKPDVFLAAADADFPSILLGTVEMHKQLIEAGLNSELRIDDGRHTWDFWKKAVVPALQWLSPRLSMTCPAKSVAQSAPLPR